MYGNSCTISGTLLFWLATANPRLTLTDLAIFRISSISFFLVVILVCSLCVQKIWKRFAHDIQGMPVLSYSRACRLSLTCGLLFVAVFTMISGAREHMTPEAWQKQGLMFQRQSDNSVLPDKNALRSPDPQSQTERMAERRLKLAELRHLLERYSDQHNGNYPESREASGFPPESWELPDVSRLQYVYNCCENSPMSDPDQPLAIEPDFFPGDPCILTAGGDIVTMSRTRILSYLSPTDLP